MSRTLFVFLVFCLFGLLLADDQQREEDQPSQQSTGLSNLSIPAGDFTLSDSFFRAVGTAGALVTGIAGLAAIVSFILPIFGFRTCALFGTCDNNAYDNSIYTPNMASNSVYDQNGYSGYQYGNNNAFGKRSLEYVGPILKMLSAAYDKYGPKARSMRPTAQVPTPTSDKIK